MAAYKIFTSVLLLVTVVSGQYNYPSPPREDIDGYQYNKPTTPPPRTYLPPSTTTPKPYESESDVAADALGPDEEHMPGMPYDFTYAVKDDVGNDFSHKADSDGETVKGEYRTLLPDGRLQIVKYTADWKNGYNAEITYEGEAQYPEEQPRTPAPTRPPPPPPQPTPPRNEFEEDNDSQGLYPSTTTTNRPVCYPGSTDPRCPQTTTQPPLRCYPGSTDPRCPQPTTQPPLRCYPGSTDPRCPQPTTQPPIRCYPGSSDPRCPQPTTTPPPRCYPGSNDPRCPTTTTKYVRPTQRTTPEPPPGLYGAPPLPFGTRNNPKFGYSRK